MEPDAATEHQETDHDVVATAAAVSPSAVSVSVLAASLRVDVEIELESEASAQHAAASLRGIDPSSGAVASSNHSIFESVRR